MKQRPKRLHKMELHAWHSNAKCSTGPAFFRELHERFLGFQDKHTENTTFPYPFRSSLETEPVLVTAPLTSSRCCIDLTGLSHERTHELRGKHMSNCGVRNIRLTGPNIDQIENISYEVGGQRFDVVHHEPMGVVDKDGYVNFWMFRQDRVWPFVQYHELHLVVTFKPTIKHIPYDSWPALSWEVVETEGFSCVKAHEFITFQFQFTGPEYKPQPDQTGRYVYPAPFNHPMTTVWVRTERPVRAMRLVMDKLYEVPFQYDEHYKQWVIEFVPTGEYIDLNTTVNASRVEQLKVEVESDENPGTVHVWSLNSHVIRIISGMAGLAFSK